MGKLTTSLVFFRSLLKNTIENFVFLVKLTSLVDSDTSVKQIAMQQVAHTLPSKEKQQSQ